MATDGRELLLELELVVKNLEAITKLREDLERLEKETDQETVRKLNFDVSGYNKVLEDLSKMPGLTEQMQKGIDDAVGKVRLFNLELKNSQKETRRLLVQEQRFKDLVAVVRQANKEGQNLTPATRKQVERSLNRPTVRKKLVGDDYTLGLREDLGAGKFTKQNLAQLESILRDISRQARTAEEELNFRNTRKEAGELANEFRGIEGTVRSLREEINKTFYNTPLSKLGATQIGGSEGILAAAGAPTSTEDKIKGLIDDVAGPAPKAEGGLSGTGLKPSELQVLIKAVRELNASVLTLNASAVKLNNLFEKSGGVIRVVGNRAKKAGKDVKKGVDDADESMTKWQKTIAAIKEQQGGRGVFGQAVLSTARLAYYGFAAGLIYNLAQAFRFAISQAVEFEQTLADIQSVLPSRSIIGREAISDVAIRNAERFGAALSETAEAAKTFAQAGQSLRQIEKSLEASFYAVRGANLPLADAKNLVIAIQNITEGELEALDVLNRISRLESQRAVTAGDLATGIQRIGPVVRQLRGDMVGLADEFDVALGAITTIVERTRVSGSNAATSLRFILSRLGSADIVQRLQDISGVGLAREGGQQLRPFVEILQDLSAVYQEFQATGQSFKAAQLLTSIGGARQIQATSTLLEDFNNTTLRYANIGAKAFNDVNERSSITMNTLSTDLQKLQATFASLGVSITNNPFTNGVLRFAVNALKSGLEGLNTILDRTGYFFDELRAFFTGRSRIAIEPISFDDLDDASLNKITKYTNDAAEMGLTVDELNDRLVTFIETFQETARIQFNFDSVEDLYDAIGSSKVVDTFTDLREVQGLELAGNLAEVSDKFENLVTTYQNAETEVDRLQAKNALLAETYDLVARAAFKNTAAQELLTQRVRGQLDLVVEELEAGLDQGLEKVRGILGGNFADVIFSGTSRKNFGELVLGQFEGLADSFGEGMNDIVKSLKEGSITGVEFSKAITRVYEETDIARGANKNLLGVLDQFGVQLRQNTDAFDEAVEAAYRQIDALLEVDAATGTVLNTTAAAGKVFEEVFGDVFRKAAERFLEANPQIEATSDTVDRFAQIMQNANTASRDMAIAARSAFVRVNQELFNLLGNFTTTVDKIEKLGVIYDNIGQDYDKTQQLIGATQGALESLVGLQGELTMAAAESGIQYGILKGEIESVQTKLQQSQTAAAGDDEAAQAFADALSGQEQTTQQLRRASNEYQSLVSQLSELSSGDLRNVFGDTNEGRQLLEILDRIGTESVDIGADQMLRNTTALINALSQIQRINLETAASLEKQKILEDFLLQRQTERATQAERLLQATQQTESSREALFRQTSASLAEALGGPNAVLGTQLQNARNERRIEIRQAKELLDQKNQVLNVERDLRASQIERRRDDQSGILGQINAQVEFMSLMLDIAQRRNQALNEYNLTLVEADQKAQQAFNSARLELFTQNIQNLYAQIQTNVTSATSGLQDFLSSYESFSSGGIANILSPISTTFLDRAAENFTSNLFDATRDDFFGKIARAYGEAPETRLRNQLNNSFQTGGQIVAQYIVSAFAAGASGASVLPPEEINKLQNLDIGEDVRLSATDSLKGMGALLATQAGAALGGGNQVAQIGSGIGSTLGFILGGGPAGGAVGGFLGGLLGRAFGGSGSDRNKQTKALEKIEYNTREAADLLELERQFRDVSRGSINVPSNFVVPGYTPQGGSSTTVQQNNTITIPITVDGSQNPDQVVAVIRDQLGPALTDELRKIGL